MRKITLCLVLFILAGFSFAQRSGDEPTKEERIAQRNEHRLLLNINPSGNRVSAAPLAGQALLTWDHYSSVPAGYYTTTIGATVIGWEGLTSISLWDYESRALFVFDVSSLSSGNYAFMADVAQDSGLTKTCSIYDAEDFGLQKVGPYSNADVTAAFTGSGTIIESVDFPASGDVVFPLVSANVNADLVGGLSGFILDIDEVSGAFFTWGMADARLEALAGVPTLGTYSLIGLISIFAVIGIVMIRRNQG